MRGRVDLQVPSQDFQTMRSYKGKQSDGGIEAPGSINTIGLAATMEPKAKAGDCPNELVESQIPI